MMEQRRRLKSYLSIALSASAVAAVDCLAIGAAHLATIRARERHAVRPPENTHTIFCEMFQKLATADCLVFLRELLADRMVAAPRI